MHFCQPVFIHYVITSQTFFTLSEINLIKLMALLAHAQYHKAETKNLKLTIQWVPLSSVWTFMQRQILLTNNFRSETVTNPKIKLTYWCLLETKTPRILLSVKTLLSILETIGSTCMEELMKKIVTISKNLLEPRNTWCVNSRNSKFFKSSLQMITTMYKK